MEATVAAVFLASCSHPSSNCNEIQCVLDDNHAQTDGTWAYLRIELGLDSFCIDSVQIKDNSFCFTIPNAAEPHVASIFLGSLKRRLVPVLFIEPGRSELDLKESRVVRGTNLNDRWASYSRYNDSLGALATVHIENIQSDANLVKEADSLINIYSSQVTEQSRAFAKKTIRENRDNVVGQYLFGIYIRNLGPNVDYAEFNRLITEAGPFLCSSPIVQKYEKLINAREATKEGAHFVDFTVADGSLEGTSVKLSDYVGKGRVVLVSFWASWCRSCQRDMPNIRRIHEKYFGPDFDVLSVAVTDDPVQSRKAIAKMNMSWEQIINAGRMPLDLYGIRSIPYMILFDADGNIVARDVKGASVDMLIDSLIK